MSANWIKHTPSTTPAIKTDDDVCRVDYAHICAFFAQVKNYFIHVSSSTLPQDLFDEATNSAPQDLAEVICNAVAEGIIMDSGWLDHYGVVFESVAESLRGYPRVCIAQLDAIRNAVAGRATTRAKSRKDSGAHADLSKEAEVKGFRFFELPPPIQEQIYSLVIPTSTLTVSDWAFGSVPKYFNERGKRTEYEVPDVNGQLRRTTYVVHVEPPNCRSRLNFMLANRVVYQNLSSRLYTSKFDFRGTAAGTLAFLHDHMVPLSKVKSMSIRYVTTSRTPFLGCTYVDPKPPPTLKTNLQIWKNILKVLIQSASELEDFELIIDKNFWERAPWKDGAEAIMRDKSLCEPLLQSKKGLFRNFLVDVSKLSGVNFWLTIERAENDPEKMKFIRGLQTVIGKRMQGMPYLADRNAACSCKKRLLREACAWEDEAESKRRRSGGG